MDLIFVNNYKKNELANLFVGTPEYIAPEII
jgi:hypothetical protein